MPVQSIFAHFHPFESPCPWPDLEHHITIVRERLKNHSVETIIQRGRDLNRILTIESIPQYGLIDSHFACLASMYVRYIADETHDSDQNEEPDNVENAAILALVAAGMHASEDAAIPLEEDEIIISYRNNANKSAFHCDHSGFQSAILKHQFDWRLSFHALVTLSHREEKTAFSTVASRMQAKVQEQRDAFNRNKKPNRIKLHYCEYMGDHKTGTLLEAQSRYIHDWGIRYFYPLLKKKTLDAYEAGEATSEEIADLIKSTLEKAYRNYRKNGRDSLWSKAYPDGQLLLGENEDIYSLPLRNIFKVAAPDYSLIALVDQ